MSKISLASSLLLTASFATAQVTSPRGFDTIEGNASFVHWGGSRRFQQIDYTQAGAPMAISSIAWRRNGGSSSTAGPRTFDFTVDMGHADFGLISHILDDNYLPGTRTTVFNQTAVSFPDWNTALPGPAPFDFQISLPTAFTYNGFDSLVIDFSYANNSSTANFSTDREFTGQTTPTPGALLAGGCVASGNTAAFSHAGYTGNQDNSVTTAYGLRLRLGGANAPSTGGVFAMLDPTNLNLSGLLCDTLYPAPNILIPMQTVGTTVPDVNLQFPYVAALLGASLYSQLAAPDAGQSGIPVVVSNGRQLTIPSTPVPAHRCSYGWYSTPSTTGVATQFIGGGLVMQLQ
ncbi:MAG: hypothetical protein R3F56_05915 [Planctomycetota bacterium]